MVYRRYATYRRLLLTYLLMLSATAAMLCGIMYGAFSHQNTRDVERYSVNSLREGAKITDSIVEQTDNVLGQMLADPNYILALYGKSISPILKYDVMRSFQDLRAMNAFISGMVLYNANAGAYVSAMPPGEALKTLMEAGDYRQTRRLVQVPNPSRLGPASLLGILMDPNYFRDADELPGVLFYLDYQYLGDKLRDLARDGQQLFIVDGEGTVMSHTNGQEYMQSYGDEGFVRTLLARPEASGSFSADAFGERCHITYLKTSTFGWAYVSVTPLGDIMAGQRWVLGIALTCTLALTALVFLLGMGIVKRLYKPIDELFAGVDLAVDRGSNEFVQLKTAYAQTMQNLTSMEDSIKSAYGILRQNYFSSLLRGDFDLYADIARMYDSLNHELTGPEYCVVLLRLEQGDEGGSALRGEDDFQYVREACGLLLGAEVVAAAPGELVAIFQMDSRFTDESFQALITDFHQKLRREGLWVTMAAGSRCTGKEQLQSSYEDANNAMQLRFFLGAGSLITHRGAQQRQSGRAAYPQALEQKVVKAIHAQQPGKLSQALEAVEKQVRNNSVSDALLYLKRLQSTVLLQFSGEDALNDAPEFLPDDTLSDIMGLLLEQFTALCKAPNVQRSTTNRQLYRDILDYIGDNYADSALSVQAVSERFGISESQLGRLLKANGTDSFVGLVTGLRMEHAKTLILEGKYPLAEVIGMVGINSTSYFHALFKRYYGTTPRLYRLKHLNE